MESRAKMFGHAIHPMLVHFPLALLEMAVIFDVIGLVTGSPALTISSYHMILAGVLSGLVAAVFGFIDWLAIPAKTRAKSIATLHARGNVAVLLLFAASWWLRRGDPSNPTMLAFGLALLGAALALVTGWLGGELVARLGIGVDDGAHVDAPSSLSARRSQETDGA